MQRVVTSHKAAFYLLWFFYYCSSAKCRAKAWAFYQSLLFVSLIVGKIVHKQKLVERKKPLHFAVAVDNCP